MSAIEDHIDRLVIGAIEGGATMRSSIEGSIGGPLKEDPSAIRAIVADSLLRIVIRSMPERDAR